jgi:hypothetical protein
MNWRVYFEIVDSLGSLGGPKLIGHTRDLEVADPHLQHLVHYRLGLSLLYFRRACRRLNVEARPRLVLFPADAHYKGFWRDFSQFRLLGRRSPHEARSSCALHEEDPR